MTNDTEKAMEIIKPMAKELNIDVSADDHCLYCNGQAIGIACNSTFATINEFLGYAMLRMMSRNPSRWRGVPNGFDQQVKKYWVSSATLRDWRQHWQEEGRE